MAYVCVYIRICHTLTSSTSNMLVTSTNASAGGIEQRHAHDARTVTQQSPAGQRKRGNGF